MPKIKKTAVTKKRKAPVKADTLNILNKVLDKIRPALIRDNGNLELISYDAKNGIVDIHLQGACAHCPLADVTLKHIIEAEIKNELPEVKEVRAI